MWQRPDRLEQASLIVEHEGAALESLWTSRRDQAPAPTFLEAALKRRGPMLAIVRDDRPGTWRAAMKQFGYPAGIR